jgi:hypothetical protein
MSDTTTGEDHDSPLEAALAEIRTRIDEIVDEQCHRHYPALTQEHQFTSGLARIIEHEIDGLEFDGLKLEVKAQDFPDRGRGALERQSGADLYLSLVRNDGDEPVSKGMLVQSKWDRALNRPAETQRLQQQSGKMLRHSRDSYVWVYGPTGIASIPAQMTTSPPRGPIFRYGPSTVGELIAAGLRCNAGDPQLGRDVGPVAEGLNAIQQRLGSPTALSLVLQGDSD